MGSIVDAPCASVNPCAVEFPEPPAVFPFDVPPFNPRPDEVDTPHDAA
jgi:hypothetical protein